jgi:hypothetical protein
VPKVQAAGPARESHWLRGARREVHWAPIRVHIMKYMLLMNGTRENLKFFGTLPPEDTVAPDA